MSPLLDALVAYFINLMQRQLSLLPDMQINLKRKHWSGNSAEHKSGRLQKIFKKQMQTAKVAAQQKEVERRELAEAFRCGMLHPLKLWASPCLMSRLQEGFSTQKQAHLTYEAMSYAPNFRSICSSEERREEGACSLHCKVTLVIQRISISHDSK